MYIQANIGRNVAKVEASTNNPTGAVEPTGDTAWLNFQNDVKEEIMMSLLAAGLGGRVSLSSFEVHTGVGEWDGVKEESAHVSVFFETNDVISALGVARDAVTRAMEDKMSYLAFQYGQDAIAFVVTDSHLATR